MSVALTYGRVRPQDGDRGSTFFDQLAANITLDDAHSHNGVDSAPVAATALTATTQTIDATAWVAVVGIAGLFSRVVAMPGVLTVDAFNPTFRITAATDVTAIGALAPISFVKVTSTSFRVYTNDNALTLLVVWR